MFVEHIPVMIDGPPYPVFPAGNGDDDLVQVPHIVAAGLLAAKATRIIWAELLSPAADCFIGDGNAALQQQRGGSVCLNSFGRFAKWISASIMPPPSMVSAR